MSLQADPFRFFLAIGALSGLVSIAFHSFFDFNLQMPANCVYFVMLMGIIDVCLWGEGGKVGIYFVMLMGIIDVCLWGEGGKVGMWEGKKVGREEGRKGRR